MFRPTSSLKLKIKTTFKHQNHRYGSEVMKIHINFDSKYILRVVMDMVPGEDP